MIIEIGQTKIQINDYPIPKSKVIELANPVIELFLFEFMTTKTIDNIKSMIDEIVTSYIKNSRDEKINELLKF